MARVPHAAITLAVLLAAGMAGGAEAQDLASAAAAIAAADAAAPTATATVQSQELPFAGLIGGVVCDPKLVPISSMPESQWQRDAKDETLGHMGHGLNLRTTRYMAQRVTDPHGHHATGVNAVRARGALYNRRATWWIFGHPEVVRPEAARAD